jgi:hypothetical protein
LTEEVSCHDGVFNIFSVGACWNLIFDCGESIVEVSGVDIKDGLLSLGLEIFLVSKLFFSRNLSSDYILLIKIKMKYHWIKFVLPLILVTRIVTKIKEEQTSSVIFKICDSRYEYKHTFSFEGLFFRTFCIFCSVVNGGVLEPNLSNAAFFSSNSDRFGTSTAGNDAKLLSESIGQ